MALSLSAMIRKRVIALAGSHAAQIPESAEDATAIIVVEVVMIKTIITIMIIVRGRVVTITGVMIVLK